MASRLRDAELAAGQREHDAQLPRLAGSHARAGRRRGQSDPRGPETGKGWQDSRQRIPEVSEHRLESTSSGNIAAPRVLVVRLEHALFERRS
jgi:hypothetical protein